MRIHTFWRVNHGRIDIDLDQITAVEPAHNGATLHCRGHCFHVTVPADEIRKLMHGPPPQDIANNTFQTTPPLGFIDPVDVKPDGFKDHKRRNQALNHARHFELTLLELEANRIPGGFTRLDIMAYIADRKREIERGE